VRPVLDLWLNTPPRHCSPSLRLVFDLIAYCSLALFMVNSTFNPTCGDNGSVNEYVYVCFLPSATIVSDCSGGGVQHSFQQRSTHRPHCQALHHFREFTHRCSPKYSQGQVEAHQVHVRPYWENEVKHVINIPKGPLSAGFNDVPALIVKHCVQFITIPLVRIFRLSFPTGFFPDILKIAKYNLG
jgi:hypothetical protein